MDRYGTTTAWVGLVPLILGCTSATPGSQHKTPEPIEDATADSDSETDSPPQEPLCDGERINMEAVEQMLVLTEVTNSETIYSTYDRIDNIAALF